MDNSTEHRPNIIKAITSPLGFFALSLLIVEGFLGITLIFSDLNASHKFIGMLIGATLFLLVVIIVFILVWCKPKHLTFGERGHLRQTELDWGTKEKPTTEAIIEKEKSQLPTTIVPAVTSNTT